MPREIKTVQTQPEPKHDKDVLLRFSGEQDIEAFGAVCEAMREMTGDWTGGSRDYCLKAVDGEIIFCLKGALS